MKKRKYELDLDVERNMYTSFVTAANAVSQLYTHGVQQQRKASSAASKAMLEKVVHFIHDCPGEQVPKAALLQYLQYEYENVDRQESTSTPMQLMPFPGPGSAAGGGIASSGGGDEEQQGGKPQHQQHQHQQQQQQQQQAWRGSGGEARPLQSASPMHGHHRRSNSSGGMMDSGSGGGSHAMDMGATPFIGTAGGGGTGAGACMGPAGPPLLHNNSAYLGGQAPRGQGLM